MAIVKNPPFGKRGSFEADGYDRVIPVKNAGKRSIFNFRGGFIRNLGAAIIRSRYRSGEFIALYGHSQVSNGKPSAFPAVGFILDLEAAEELHALLLGAIVALKEAK